MISKLLVALTCLFVVVGCSSNHTEVNEDDNKQSEKQQQETFQNGKVTMEVAYEEMQKLDTYVILDVRTQEEFNEKHIKDAMLLPYTDIDTVVANKIPSKDTPIFVYCRSGNRSSIAYQSLIDLGYQHVYDIGAMDLWTHEFESGE